MGLGRELPLGEISSWSSSSMWGEVANLLDIYGPLCEYKDALKTPGDLMCMFERLHTALRQRRETKGCHSGLVFAVGSSAGYVQLEAEA